MSTWPFANPEYDYWADCVGMPGPQPGELVNAIRHHPKDRQVSYQAFARHADLAPLRASGHPAMYRISAPDNWAISFHRSRLPSGAPVYYFAWSGIEHFFVKEPVDMDAEVAAMGGRQQNPTQKRINWIAARYPGPVLYDTINAFAAASAQHRILDAIRFTRAGQWADEGPLTPELALRIVERTQRETGAPAHTVYDRHLPWVATVLNREHKQAMKINRRLVKAMSSEGIEGDRQTQGRERLWREDVLDGLRGAQNVDEIAVWLSSNDSVRKEYARHSTAEILAHDYHDYKRAATKLEENLIAIVEWAEAESIDLNTYKELEDVIEQAQTWAEEQAELIDCDEVLSGTVYCWPDGWTVVELESTEELVCEGRVLAHCVKDYTLDDLVVGGGDSRFFSLRDPTGKRVTTMMFDTTKRNVPGHALRGFANKTPEVSELARMYEFRMTHPALRPLWRDSSNTVGQWMTQMDNWEGRYSREEYDHLGRAVGWETLDVFRSGLFDADEVSRAHDWMLHNWGDSEYESAMDWLKSADFAEQREDAGLPPMTENEMEDAASAQVEHELQSQLGDFDPDTLRQDYGYEINERTFNGQDALAGDLAWVHYLATGEELGGWDEGDEMVDWMQTYRRPEQPGSGVAFFGTDEPAIWDHAQGSRRTGYPFPPGSDYGVVMRLVVHDEDATGKRPPSYWQPERLHAPGSVNCLETVKQRLLA